MDPVSLGDIKDAEAFVKYAIKRARVPVAQYEYDDVVCEGLLVLCRLYVMYDPSRDRGSTVRRTDGSTNGVASFAGYASYLLPGKIRDAWHRMHEEHLLRTQEDGTRRYEYGTSPRSLSEAGSMDGHGGTDLLDSPGIRLVGDFVAPTVGGGKRGNA